MKPLPVGPDTLKRARVARFFLYALAFFGLIAAVLDAMTGNWVIVALGLSFFVLTPFIAWLSRRERFALLPTHFVLGAMLVLIIVGILSQLHRPENLIWMPLFPLTFYFVGGPRTGSFLSLLSLAAFPIGYVAYPHLHAMAPVPPVFFAQLLAAYCLSTVIAYYYEHVRARQESLLHEQAMQDYLTGLPNRRGFFQVAGAVTGQVKRLQQPFSVILFDLDDFKSVNDRFGHAVGDALLKETAHRVQQKIRGGDVLARWGGEEFVVLLPQNRLAGAAALAEKLRTEIGSYTFPPIGQITASFGVAEHAAPEDIEALIARADRALYRAKRAGKNRVEAEAG